MESFSLLRYWRGSATSSTAAATTARTTTIAASLLRPSPDSDSDSDSGPFFDLEFAVPDTEQTNESSDDEDKDFKFAVSNTTLSLSPADDVFFKGRLAPADPAAGDSADSRPTNLPISLTKLRIFLLRYRRPKTETDNAAAKHPIHLSKLFVNFKVEEAPIVSLFTRDNSGRAAKAAAPQAPQQPPPPAAAKDSVHKYLSRIKPMYVRVSKRYGEKLRFSGAVGKVAGEETDAEAEAAQHSVVPAGLRVMRKRLGKSRSAPFPVAAVTAEAAPPPKRRDDSLLQLQDGIQSAIAHCKRSFNVTRGPESALVRSMSDPGDGGRSDKSVNEGKGTD